MSSVAISLVATMKSTNFGTATTVDIGSTNSDFESFMNRSSESQRTVTEADANRNINENSQAEAIKNHQDTYESKRIDIYNKQSGGDDDLVEDVSEMEEVVVEKIAQMMEISEDELKEMLNAQGMSLTDLFDPIKLQSFMMNVLGISDVSELLVSDVYNELTNEVTSILQETLTDFQLNTEDISRYNQLIEQMKTESVTEKVVPELITTNEQETVNTSTDNNEVQVQAKEQESSQTQNNSSNQQSSEFENQFSQALNQVVTEKVTTINMDGFEETIFTQVSARNIFDQIVTQMRVISVGDKATLSFQLQPENLGKVAFSISNENGIITGQFMAENNTVKEALELNLLNLKNNLLEQGIKVDDLKVVVGETKEFFDQQERQQFSQNQQNKRNKRAMNLEGIIANMNGPDEMDLTEPLGLDSISEHSVEFSA